MLNNKSLNTNKITNNTSNNDFNNFIQNQIKNNNKNTRHDFINDAIMKSYKDEIINFFDEIKPKVFISISFNDSNLSNEKIKANVKKIFIEYYKFKYGKNWIKKLHSIELKYFLIIESGKTRGHNHCHILLNSNLLDAKMFARELTFALKQFKKTLVYNIVFNNIGEENKVNGFNTIVINDIYDKHNLYNYLLKEIPNINNKTDFSNIIPWNEIIYKEG
ncbi:MAG: hypothetical protein N4A44_04430 [Alphaproteobacteria bacterium]|nr:hypothetical protein [Alphaproteobacteria bacterium]